MLRNLINKFLNNFVALARFKYMPEFRTCMLNYYYGYVYKISVGIVFDQMGYWTIILLPYQ